MVISGGPRVKNIIWGYASQLKIWGPLYPGAQGKLPSMPSSIGSSDITAGLASLVQPELSPLGQLSDDIKILCGSS